MSGERFAILTVCHANLCRSPLVERLLRHGLTGRLGPRAAAFEVSSAGTHAMAGAPMHPHSATVLREWGGDGTGFHSRLLGPTALPGADLILTADRAQRGLCVTTAPSVVDRAFTMRQFGRLAAAVDPDLLPDGSPVERARALVAEARAVRAELQPVASQEDDLPDPVGLSLDAFRQCARLIHEELVEVMLDRLAPR